MEGGLHIQTGQAPQVYRRMGQSNEQSMEALSFYCVACRSISEMRFVSPGSA